MDHSEAKETTTEIQFLEPEAPVTIEKVQPTQVTKITFSCPYQIRLSFKISDFKIIFQKLNVLFQIEWNILYPALIPATVLFFFCLRVTYSCLKQRQLYAERSRVVEGLGMYTRPQVVNDEINCSELGLATVERPPAPEELKDKKFTRQTCWTFKLPDREASVAFSSVTNRATILLSHPSRYTTKKVAPSKTVQAPPPPPPIRSQIMPTRRAPPPPTVTVAIVHNSQDGFVSQVLRPCEEGTLV